MIKHQRNLLLLASLFILNSQAAAAQTAEPLFVVRSAASANASQETVGMRLDRLFAATTDRVLLNVGDHEWVAQFERLDRDASGHRVWVGHIENVDYSHVSFAERNGVVSGLINALSEVYDVRTIAPGAYRVERAAAGGDQRELEPLVDTSSAAAGASAAPAPQMASDDRATIDVLLLYTPRAVTRVGGLAQMQALIARIISDSNTIYSRSGITTRLRLAGSQEFALTETTSMSSDLTVLTNSTIARGLRDQYRADLVQLLEETGQSGVCGIAWLMTSLTTNFNGYSVADVDCASQYTPTHEMGHNMGSHHAPEDDAAGALFPYSYGYKDPARGFRTVMAYACSGASCPRIPNMSSPSVTHNGGVTGTTTQDNALSINNAAQTVANFRQQATTPVTPPGVPTGLRSTVTGSTVTLAWNAVTTDVDSAADAATSYTLQVGNTPGASNLFSQSVGNTTSVTGSVPGGSYFWRVIAVNSAGQSTASTDATFTVGACTAPGVPLAFSYTITGRVVTLSWLAPLTGTAPFSYVLEAGSASGLSNLYSASVGSLTTLSVQAPPGLYFVRIRAQNACGTSSPSSESTVVVP